MSSDDPNTDTSPTNTQEPTNMNNSQNEPILKCCLCGAPGNKRCGKCRQTIYCSEKCQREDWQQNHKATCKPMEEEADSVRKIQGQVSQMKVNNEQMSQQLPSQAQQSNDPTAVNETPEQPKREPQPSRMLTIILKRLDGRGMPANSFRITVEASLPTKTLESELCSKLHADPAKTRFWLENKNKGTFSKLLPDGYGLLDKPELSLDEAGFVGAEQKLLMEEAEFLGEGTWYYPRDGQPRPQRRQMFDDDDDDDEEDPRFGGMQSHMRGNPMMGNPMMGNPMGNSMNNPMMFNPMLAQMLGLNPAMLQNMFPRQKSAAELEEEHFQKALQESMLEEQKRIEAAKKAEEEKKKIEQEQNNIRSFYETAAKKDDGKKKEESIHDDFDELEHNLENDDFEEEEEEFDEDEEEPEED